ncbi:MAG: pantoate--beta-alanine ligase [Acidobacteriota bacterium]
MKLIRKISDLRESLKTYDDKSSTGFIPTMGFLHEGHLSLIKKSISENDVTIVSIFVNPIQFGPEEDFGTYPRDLKKDTILLESFGVDILFHPEKEEIFPENFNTTVKVSELDNVLCGASRPGHFDGVTTIVMKLFNIIDPDIAYFGQKDAQQLIIIKKMTMDLNLDVKLKSIPVVREKDGLAMSSRNIRLSEKGRKSANILNRALKISKETIVNNKVFDPDLIKELIRKMIESEKSIIIDYIEIVSLDLLEKIKKIDMNNTLVAVAINIDGVRLIDNFILGDI